MWERLKQVWAIEDLRKSILFVIAILVLVRFVAHVPIPGIDVDALQRFISQNQIIGLLNIFSGGTLENFSIVMMGVGPYITASIIFQLLGMIVPAIEELQKEGESGQQRINQWTRMATVPLALLQSFGTINLLRQSQANIFVDLTTFKLIAIMITVTAGSMFLVWLGELISEKSVGNGISILIFANIIASLPTVIQRTVLTFDQSQAMQLIAFGVVAVVTILGVVFITQGQRIIPIQYARQMRGSRMFGGVSTHLPIKVNMAGVIPIIFAISLVLFPPLIAQFFVRAQTAWISGVAQWVIDIFNDRLIYGVLYFVLVFGFTFFYTSIIFQPEKVAENLQKQGGFVPGIRPGTETAHYLSRVTNRVMLAGALFLATIAVLPLVVQEFTGSGTLLIGGTSLLIVVSVVIETLNKIESQITMREYDKL
ncbi:MAG: preprotein translocase subunit SecY [Candidatus Magasanikbacteria bacterium RIFCSPHIGHO2_01_FULL_50_8]|uniref:Protein translocase subunit SecY n=2 Tax=Candidatus Magasanikiibacteriota TaxID=1752731 RepID=A0A1F6LRE1_9BACT|nr:MAG: preprotein translocase subunit SecY [Candidatus Magasanikbacteria bacterium RIFCSPHIGHO2_01_FULL_50_8]OGH67429.1 MAG: preprotein translocase subunit SecY [Candidatus Magasanikbacteria bacterium RIFCSPHIGHO2_02_FULL_50_9b]